MSNKPTFGDWYRRETLLTIALVGVSAFTLALLRGMWLDEAWTIWFTYPGLPYSAAHNRWMHDAAHPHLYLFVEWLLSPLTGTSLPWRRLTHLPLLLLVALPTLFLIRQGTSRFYLSVFSIALFTNPYFLNYFAEHRGYNLALGSLSCLAIFVRHLHMKSAAGEFLNLPEMIWFASLTAINLNTHYTFAITALALIGCTAVVEIGRKRMRLAIFLITSTGILVVPVIIRLLVAVRIEMPPGPVSISIPAGLSNIAWMLAVGFLSNPALAFSAARNRPLVFHPSLPQPNPDTSAFILILLGTLAICTLALVAMHLITRSVIPRLAMCLLVPAMLILTELISIRGLSRREFRIVCLAGAGLVLATTLHQADNKRWEYNVGRIKQAISRCPSTQVVAVPVRYAGDGIGGQESEVHLFGYRLLARQHGFPLLSVPGQGVVRANGTHCPILLWREQYFGPEKSTTDWLKIAHVAAEPEQVALTRIFHEGSHVLVVVPPLHGTVR